MNLKWRVQILLIIWAGWVGSYSLEKRIEDACTLIEGKNGKMVLPTVRICRSHFADEAFKPGKKDSHRCELIEGALPLTAGAAKAAKRNREADELASTSAQYNRVTRHKVYESPPRKAPRPPTPQQIESELRRELAELKQLVEKLTKERNTALEKRDTALEQLQEAKKLLSERDQEIRALAEERAALLSQLYELRAELEPLRALSKKSIAQLTIEHLCANDHLINEYTAFHNGAAWKKCISIMEDFHLHHAYNNKDNRGVPLYGGGAPLKLTFEQGFLLFSMRNVCNFDFDHLAYLFHVNKKTARTAYHRVLMATATMFDQPLFQRMFTPAGLLAAEPLPCFTEFPSTVLVLDCSESFIQTPSKSELNKLTWSNYKHHNTIKYLVGINRAGEVVFVSGCKPGRISDRQIIEITRVLEQVPKKHKVMADKGFLIFDLAEKHDIEIEIPPLASNKQQFSPENLSKGRKIAATRIHVERAINRAKRFRLLSHEIKNSMLPYISKVVKVCFMLTNLMGDLVLDTEA